MEAKKIIDFQDDLLTLIFDVSIDGFYEIKISGRDFSPDSIDNPLYQTITNDEAYKKNSSRCLKRSYAN